jgi:hypothetical protein
MGVDYNPSHIRVLACSSQIGHFINSNFKDTDIKLDGEPQIINLPFKCVEGTLSGGNAMWMMWHKKGGALEFNNCHHGQFFHIPTVRRCESQHTYAVESERRVQHVLDDSDASCIEGPDDGDANF